MGGGGGGVSRTNVRVLYTRSLAGTSEEMDTGEMCYGSAIFTRESSRIRRLAPRKFAFGRFISKNVDVVEANRDTSEELEL